MKKIYTLNLAALSLLILLFACKKEPRLPEGVKLPTLTINRISELPFSNTEWEHVFGGMAEVTYTKGSTSTTDSVNMAKLSAYGKTLELGTYDIQLRSKSAATADSFVRFSSELKGQVVDKGQALTFAGNTNDGLITIRKELVSDNSVPSFITTQGGKSYKMGLTEGYYFIYVKGGTSGQVSFYSKTADDQITKNMTIATSNHYNLVVVTNGPSSIGIQMTKFAYNEVEVGSPTLITIKIPPAGFQTTSSEITFMISDDQGKILGSVKYESGMSIIKLNSKEPYTKDRVSAFMLTRYFDISRQGGIIAYMNVKRGSIWTPGDLGLLPAKPFTYPLKVSVKNLPAFDFLTFSTDRSGLTMESTPDVPAYFARTNHSFSDESKLFLKLENKEKAFYHFFDISKGTQNVEIDAALCTSPALSKTISLPAAGGMYVIGRKDKSYEDRYYLGTKQFAGNSGVFFYPDEPFEEYYTVFTYSDSNGFHHLDSYRGASIPQTTTPLNVSFEENGRSLTTFQPTFTGTFDYYQVGFTNSACGMDVTVPSAAVSYKLVYPDFTALPGYSNFTTAGMTLRNLLVCEYEGFAEEKFYYKNLTFNLLHGKQFHKNY